ncbi:DUF3761 domain-containing protein [Massilia sp. S19_KUP03_FR1]|uniref:DUF3761 domain-containing protein n=1 Tax=Massilia sp. S19_KUP03_FR1 TaxID=3025503 RepID=UPI003FA59293
MLAPIQIERASTRNAESSGKAVVHASLTFSQHRRGTCSRHGGVSRWLWIAARRRWRRDQCVQALFRQNFIEVVRKCRFARPAPASSILMYRSSNSAGVECAFV